MKERTILQRVGSNYPDDGFMKKSMRKTSMAKRRIRCAVLELAKGARPKMTAFLAEKRAVGKINGSSFDGVNFIRSLKK